MVSAQKLNNKQFKPLENSTFECLYQYSIDGINKDGVEFTEVFNTILQGGETIAKFWDYGAFVADSVANCSNASDDDVKQAKDNLIKQIYYYDAEIFQNVPKGKISENGIIGLNYYTYNEPQENMKWSLLSDTLTVLKTLCNKATVEFGGRVWTAWYAPSIPASYGPWKLSGLPGLILKATEDSGMHTFEAISIRSSELPIYEDLSKMRTKIAKAKYLKAKVINEYDPTNIEMGTFSTYRIVINGGAEMTLFDDIVVRAHPNGYHSLEVVELKPNEVPKPREKLDGFPEVEIIRR